MEKFEKKINLQNVRKKAYLISLFQEGNSSENQYWK
jgi:hypothetical protein